MDSDTYQIHIKKYVIIVVRFCLMSFKISMKWCVASLQLPAKYRQLPVLLIGKIETLMRRIMGVCVSVISNFKYLRIDYGDG